MMSSSNWPWNELGLDCAPETIRDVKRAYARRLKQVRPEEDADGFQRLRDAYEYALQITEQQDNFDRRQITPPPAPVPDNSPAELTPNFVDPTSADLPAEAPDIDPRPRLDPLPIELEPFSEPFPGSVDWDGLGDLIERTNAQFDRGLASYLTEDWRTLLDDPVLVSIDVSQEYEAYLLQQLLDRTGYNWSKVPVRPDGMSREFAELIDERFHWHSDGVGLIQRHGGAAEWIQEVLAEAGLQIERPAEEFQISRYGEKPPWLFRWQTPLVLYGVFRLITAI